MQPSALPLYRRHLYSNLTCLVFNPIVEEMKWAVLGLIQIFTERAERGMAGSQELQEFGGNHETRNQNFAIVINLKSPCLFPTLYRENKTVECKRDLSGCWNRDFILLMLEKLIPNGFYGH